MPKPYLHLVSTSTGVSYDSNWSDLSQTSVVHVVNPSGKLTWTLDVAVGNSFTTGIVGPTSSSSTVTVVTTSTNAFNTLRLNVAANTSTDATKVYLGVL